MRLFVSVDLDGLESEVAAVQEPLADRTGLRLTDPEQAHVTLRFVGEVAQPRVDELAEAISRGVEEADVGPFEASFGGYGVFPSLDYISVVWLGVREGGEELVALHEAVEDRMTDLGFEPEDEEFVPHVTLARMEHAGAKEHVQRLVRSRDPDAGSRRVEEVRLTESTLTEDGPVYETRRRFPL